MLARRTRCEGGVVFVLVVYIYECSDCSGLYCMCVCVCILGCIFAMVKIALVYVCMFWVL